MPRVVNPVTKKVHPNICKMMLQLSQEAKGRVCDRLEISPITLQYNLLNNTPPLQKAKWQNEIRRALSIAADQDINVDIKPITK